MGKKTTYRRAGATEPLVARISHGEGPFALQDLSSVQSIKWFFEDEDGNPHVQDIAGSVVDSNARTIQLDPVNSKVGSGNAFDTPGKFEGYAKITFTDGDWNAYPAGKDLVVVVVPAQ